MKSIGLQVVRHTISSFNRYYIVFEMLPHFHLQRICHPLYLVVQNVIQKITCFAQFLNTFLYADHIIIFLKFSRNNEFFRNVVNIYICQKINPFQIIDYRISHFVDNCIWWNFNICDFKWLISYYNLKLQ